MASALIPYVNISEINPTIGKHLMNEGAKFDIACANWPERNTADVKSAALIAHNGTHLLIHFVSGGEKITANITDDLGAVASESCVEFFVQPIPGGEYWNFEFNAIGTANASHRQERPHPTRLTADELASIIRIPDHSTSPITDGGTGEWQLTVGIPLNLLGITVADKPVAIRANLYKCAGSTDTPHYLSAFPIATEKPDFHRPEYFGELILAPKMA